MGYEKQNIGEIFATRAMADYEQAGSQISIPKIREARDLVYNGVINTPSSESPATDNVLQTRVKKPTRRKVSPFTIVLFLLCGAVASVLYIGNILTVGRLMSQINKLQIKHQRILNDQELLKVQINRLAGLERIQSLAHDQIGLQNPKQLPVWIEVDPERVGQIEKILQKQLENKR